MKSHDREEVVSSEDADMGHCGSVLNQPHMQIKKSNDHVSLDDAENNSQK